MQARSRSSRSAVDLVERRVTVVRIGDVHAGHPQVAGVEADAEARVRASASKIVASSSTERPIVPPAPAEFSSRSHVVSEQRSSALLERRHGPLEAGVEAGAEVRADVEYDTVRLDRASDVDGRLERSDRLLVELVSGEARLTR